MCSLNLSQSINTHKDAKTFSKIYSLNMFDTQVNWTGVGTPTVPCDSKRSAL